MPLTPGSRLGSHVARVAACALALFASAHAAAPEPLDVMSFNIRYGTANDG